MTLSIPVPVGALKDLAGTQEMERLILERSEAFILDEVIAQELTELGYRSPLIYDRIHNGTIQVDKDPKTRLFLFPDEPETIQQFKLLRAGQFQHLRFSRGHQDA